MTSVIKVDNIQSSSGTSAMTINSDGSVALAKNPCWLVYDASAQTIPAATSTKLQFDSSSFVYDATHDTTNFTIKPLVAGVYSIGCQVRVGTNNANGDFWIEFHKNGSQFHRGHEFVDTVSGEEHMYQNQTTTLVEVNGTTDVLSVSAYAGNSVSVGYADLRYTNRFFGHLVRAS